MIEISIASKDSALDKVRSKSLKANGATLKFSYQLQHSSMLTYSD